MKNINIYVIYGYIFLSEGEWFLWLKEQFKNGLIIIYIFNMFNLDNFYFEFWFSYFCKSIYDIDENIIFIGYSFGCVILLLYIFEKNIKIKGVIFVLGFISKNFMKE